jgi:hypothetical protein
MLIFLGHVTKLTLAVTVWSKRLCVATLWSRTHDFQVCEQSHIRSNFIDQIGFFLHYLK